MHNDNYILNTLLLSKNNTIFGNSVNIKSDSLLNVQSDFQPSDLAKKKLYDQENRATGNIDYSTADSISLLNEVYITLVKLLFMLKTGQYFYF